MSVVINEPRNINPITSAVISCDFVPSDQIRIEHIFHDAVLAKVYRGGEWMLSLRLELDTIRQTITMLERVAAQVEQTHD